MTYYYDTIKKLKHSRTYGCISILSDHIIHASDKLEGYLAIIFISVLCHGLSPDGMLLSTMISLPKGKLIHLVYSDNYRVITLGSHFGKLSDFTILNKEEHQLNTTELQFSF